MKLRFLFHPVANAVEAGRFYREQFGWTELWRESDLTICVGIPGSEVGLLLDQDDIPPGRYAIFQDPAGNPVRIFDNSKDNQSPREYESGVL